jgi:hypothetical protein
MDASAYTFDTRFIGDFRVYEWQAGQIGRQAQSKVHQIWIPVVRKESAR